MEVLPIRPRRRPPEPISKVRLLTSRLRVLPDFIILGEMRAGTTSLYRYLAEHPQVLPAWEKELHYFDRLYSNGVAWYCAHFPMRTAMQWHRLMHGGRALTFEATPDYLIYPDTARRIAGVVPRAKLIALVRNPVDRAYSHYQFNIRFEGERHTFEQAVKREPKRLDGEREKLQSDPDYRSRKLRRYSYTSRGVYVDNLLAYERYVAREQMLVIKSEDFFNKTQETYDRVLEFLELAPWRLGSTQSVNAIAYGQEKPPGYEELREFYAPHNQRLYDYLGRDLGW